MEELKQTLCEQLLSTETVGDRDGMRILRPVWQLLWLTCPTIPLLRNVFIAIGYRVSVHETLLGMALMGNLFIVSQIITFLNPSSTKFSEWSKFVER